MKADPVSENASEYPQKNHSMKTTDITAVLIHIMDRAFLRRNRPP